jgi:DNA-binding transcriptional LysR family regulator
MTVEIRHLRAFLTIAEERNLTRAAQRLHLSQPALSRTLAQLERDIATRLVERSTHHVELTEAGRRFEQRAFDAVRAFETAIVSVDGHETPLRIGHTWSAGVHLSTIVRAWNRTPRPCPLVVIRNEDRSAGLTSGKVDAALTRGPIDGARFRSIVIDEEPRVAALNVAHPLSRRRKLTLADLTDGTLVPTTVGTTSLALWPEGRRPGLGTEVGTVDDWLVAIASGDGFGVSVRSTAALHRHPDVRCIPLTDAPPVPLFLAWPRRRAHPALKELLQVVEETRR